MKINSKHIAKAAVVSLVIIIVSVVPGCSDKTKYTQENPLHPKARVIENSSGTFIVNYYLIKQNGTPAGTEVVSRHEGTGERVSDVSRESHGENFRGKYMLSSTGLTEDIDSDGVQYKLQVDSEVPILDCPIFEPDVAGLVEKLCGIVGSGFEEKRIEAIIPSLSPEKQDVVVRWRFGKGWYYFEYQIEIPSRKMLIKAYKNPETGELDSLIIPGQKLEVRVMKGP